MITRSAATDLQAEFRRWLVSLGRDDLCLLAAMSENLRIGVPSPGHAVPRQLSRREWLGARAWLTKAPAGQLTQIAIEVVDVAARLLCAVHSYAPEVAADPDGEQLHRLLSTLGRPVAPVVLFGLLLHDGFSAHPVAWRHRSTLEQAVRDTGNSVTFDHLNKLEKNGNQAVGGHMDYADTTHVNTEPRDPESLTALLAEAREKADALAATLRSAADVVLGGGTVPVEIDGALAAYQTCRQKLLSALGDDIDPASMPTFDDMSAWIADLKARALRAEEERREQTRAVELAAIERRIQELQAQRDGLLSSPTATATSAQATVGRTTETKANVTADMTGDADSDMTTDATGDADESTASPQPSEPTERAEAVEPSAPVAEEFKPARTGPGSDIGAATGTSGLVPELRPRAEQKPVSEQKPVAADELEFAFPWEQGVPPLAAELVAGGRLAEAYWVTALSGEPDRRTAALRFAVAAFGARDVGEATTIQAALDLDSQSLQHDNDAATLATVALLRVALVAGWAHPLLNQMPLPLTRNERWDALLDVCVRAAESGHRVDRLMPLGVAPDDNGSVARAELGRRASTLLEDLPRRKNTYERATRVLRRLASTGQPLDTALCGVIAWAENDAPEALTAVVEQLGQPGSDDAMIEAADAAIRTPKQAREPIVSAALRGLQRSIDEVRAIVREADAVHRGRGAAAVSSEAIAHQLARAVENAAEATVPAGMTGAAVTLLHAWLRDPVGSLQPALGLAEDGEPSDDVLLSLADLPRDSAGKPDRDDLKVSRVLASMSEPVDLVAAVRTYCERGDLFRAGRVVELADDGLWPGASRATELREIVDESAKRWAGIHRSELQRTGDLFARIRGQNLLDQQSESDFAQRLESLSAVAQGRFDHVMAGLNDLADALRASQDQHINSLRTSLSELSPKRGADHDRIAALLDEGDAVTAAEFMSFLRAGQPLPAHTPSVTQDVATFAQLLAIAKERGLTDAPSTARQWADLASELAAEGRELAQSALLGVEDWDSLAEPKQHQGVRMTNAVRTILTTLGLQSTGKATELGPGARRGFRRFRVQGKPVDGSYVSLLGSATTDYTVTLIAGELRGRSVLDVLGHEDVGRANLVVYLHPLDLAARRALAAEAPNSPVQAVVIDTAVLGWVAATRPGSWRATQRVTLPWTALNPYTPFVAGLVPPEVFVGREEELAAITDPSGGLFLYGGRQLGKSALLRRVEATFDDEVRHAVYLDLKGRGIGEAEPASSVWRELARELTQRKILHFKGSINTPDVVVGQIRDWLNLNEGRRLLLLADEADAFLTADSRALPGAGGAGHFPNVLRLKELMESTGRRFKVVFAGLHQVQRFGDMSNVPLVHGGPDIPIGPLDQRNARKLVEEPMAALGYVFEKPELVWRLLSATNYQAGLIQIFCAELVATLHKRTVRATAIPVPITDDDVENVRASDRVRSRIAERMRITINLEDRYRVLTLVIAWLSLSDSFSTSYEPKDLLEYAKTYWREGFIDLGVSEVNIYLAEMEGLGLLMRLPGEDRYVVRSPNVVNMLGSMEALERELEETHFSLPYEYNPREARRLLYVDENGTQCRSPLTDGQLADLMKSNEISIVTGTVALGVERAAQAVTEYARTRDNNIDICVSAVDVAKSVSNSHRRARRTVLVANLLDCTAAEIEGMVDRIIKIDKLDDQQLTRIVIVNVADFDRCQALSKGSGEPVRPDRWTTNAIRSWPESPFDSVESRRTLIDGTGGWPELVEIAVRQVSHGSTQAQALDRVLAICTDPQTAAAMLASAGLGEDLVRRLAPWVEFMPPSDLMPLIPADIAEILGTDVATTNELLAELAALDVLDVVEGATSEHEGGVALNKVIHRCATTVLGTR
jgi:hypothetical protein